MQTAAHEEARDLSADLTNVKRLLRNAESRICGRETALQESEGQLQAARAEVQNLRARLGKSDGALQLAEARADDLQVSLLWHRNT